MPWRDVSGICKKSSSFFNNSYFWPSHQCDILQADTINHNLNRAGALLLTEINAFVLFFACKCWLNLFESKLFRGNKKKRWSMSFLFFIWWYFTALITEGCKLTENGGESILCSSANETKHVTCFTLNTCCCAVFCRGCVFILLGHCNIRLKQSKHCGYSSWVSCQCVGCLQPLLPLPAS